MHVREHHRRLGFSSILPSFHALFEEIILPSCVTGCGSKMQSLVEGSTDGVEVWVQWDTFQHPWLHMLTGASHESSVPVHPSASRIMQGTIALSSCVCWTWL